MNHVRNKSAQKKLRTSDANDLRKKSLPFCLWKNLNRRLKTVSLSGTQNETRVAFLCMAMIEAQFFTSADCIIRFLSNLIKLA